MHVEKDFSNEKLIRGRKELALSQSELAEKLETHRSTVVRWERNVNTPDYDQVLQLAALFEKPVEWFYEKKPASQDSWIDQVPWERIQDLTPGALRSLHMTSKMLAEKSGLEVGRIRAIIKGKLPTRKEIETLREVFGEEFNPVPQLSRPVPPPTVARQALTDSEKLDLILQKLSRLESEVLEMRDVLSIPSFGPGKREA